MVTLRSYGKYQGKPFQAVSYRRSEGLSPEFGYVDILLADLGSIKILPQPVPFRSPNSFQFPGGISIEAWFKLRGRATVTAARPMPDLRVGLNPWGDLELNTVQETENNAAAFAPVIYRDVHVNPGGIEEITLDLASAKLHAEGMVRVGLTDIRRFYRRYGPLLKRINARLRTGKFDPTSINSGTPWSARLVIEYLFSQLPGSPFVMNAADIDKMGLETPTDIIGEGDPAVEALDTLLKRFGLAPKFQPDGNYAVTRAVASTIPYGKVPRAVGRYEAPKFQHYEKKTVWTTDRPAAVAVIGKRRIRRITLPCIPIFQDTDGRFYPLASLQSRWGYSLSKLNNQITLGHEKAFQDVPPKVSSSTSAGAVFGGTSGVGASIAAAVSATQAGQTRGGKLHFQRREILRKWAYRGYAPAAFFENDQASLSEEDFARIPFLPFQECPMYLEEVANIGGKIPGDKTKKAGDRGQFILMQPVVRAKRFAQRFFADFREIQDYFDAWIIRHRDALNALESQVPVIVEQIRTAGENLLESSQSIESSIRRAKAGQLGSAVTGSMYDADAEAALVNAGTVSPEDADKVMTTGSLTLKRKVAMLQRGLEKLQQTIFKDRLSVVQIQQEFQKFKKVYKKLGGVQLKANIPQGVIESGHYSIDDRTGILMFSEPMFNAVQPFVLDGDGVRVATDGSVTITVGYEINENVTQDWTSVLFVAKDDSLERAAAAALPGFAGALASAALADTRVFIGAINGSSVINAEIARAPNMRLYEADLGTPYNLTEVVTEAAGKAMPLLKQAPVATGFTYTWSGFELAVLDAGVQSVQHEWDGTIAHTTVIINAPNARGPLGTPRLPGSVDHGIHETREMIETAKE